MLFILFSLCHQFTKLLWAWSISFGHALLIKSIMAVCLNESLRTTVSTSKVLVVGAGGIGCELIKNLVLTGFKNLVIVRMNA